VRRFDLRDAQPRLRTGWVLVALLALFVSAPANSASVRISAGGAGYSDSLGYPWQADFGSNTGSTLTVPETTAIDGTMDPQLFRTARWDDNTGEELTYSVPIPNGTYTLNLYFCESNSSTAKVGARVFNVRVGSTIVHSGVDIYAQAGAINKALIKSSTVQVTDGRLSITFLHVVKNPVINAIEIMPVDNQAPSVPASLSASATSSQANLSWNASTDNVGVAGYLVERCQGAACSDFTRIATPTGTAYSDSGLTANTTYRYRVRAKDESRNVSADSAMTTVTTQASQSAAIRINAGGPKFKDHSGNEWSADTGFNTGTTYSGTPVIEGTSDAELFQTGRYDDLNDPVGEMTFTTALTNGVYQVRLYFAESNPSTSAVGKRVFDVYLQGNPALRNVDVFAEAPGANRALIRTATATVTDGQLEITFVHKVKNPIINAIEITPLLAEETVPKYEILTKVLTGSSAITYSKPFAVDKASGGVAITGVFTGPPPELTTLTAHGFYNGGNTWLVRVAPTQEGTWKYTINSDDPNNPGLNNQSGSFIVGPPKDGKHGFIRSDATRPYYFSFSDGTPFYGIGDTAYGLVNGINDTERDAYLKERSLKGFNFIRFFASGFPMGPYDAGLTDQKAWPWGGTHSAPVYERLNLEYFERLESAIANLADRGMFAEVEVFNYYDCPFARIYCPADTDPTHDDPDDWHAEYEVWWAKYVMARLSAYSNVFLFTVTNEYELYPEGRYRYDPDLTNEASETPWARRMGLLFQSYDSQDHPMTVHNVYDTTNPKGVGVTVGKRFGNSTGIDVLSQQSWGASVAATTASPCRGGDAGEYSGTQETFLAVDADIRTDRGYGKPVINTENGYEWRSGIKFDGGVCTDKARKAAWRVFAGGGAAYAAGFTTTWKGHDSTDLGPFTVADEGLAAQVGYLAEFVKSTGFINMAPAQSLVDAKNICLANVGVEYVVYAPSGGVVSLNLGSSQAPKSAEWLNPYTGQYTQINVATVPRGDNGFLFTPPARPAGATAEQVDWVLRVKR